MLSAAEQLQDRRLAEYHLAQVIDECRFIERQRDLVTKRFSSIIEQERRVIADLLSGISALCSYTDLLERSLTDPSAPVDYRAIEGSKITCTRQLHILTHRHGLPISTNGYYCTPLATAERSSSSRRCLETSVEISTAIKPSKALLQSQLRQAAETLEFVGRGGLSPGVDDELQYLRERVTQLSESLRQRREDNSNSMDTCVSGVGRPRCTHCPSSVDGSHEAVASIAEEIEAQLRAYEMTVAALNTEIAVVERRYLTLERSAAEEVRALRKANRNVVEGLHDKVAEYDAVLERLSRELEQLAWENGELRRQLLALRQMEGSVQG